ncbi:hypothetical protein ACLKA7_000726 [Drosophila subpalustris]
MANSTVIETNAAGSRAPLLPSDIDFFKAKTASVMRQLAALNSFVTDELNTFDEADLLVRLETVEGMRAEFESSQSSLEKLDLLELAGDARSDFAQLYWEAKSKLSRKLDIFGKSRSDCANSTAVADHQFSASHTQSHRSRLPELQLPKFSGCYEDWPDFYAMFNTVIGNEQELSVEKGSASGLRELSDDINSHLRALSTMSSTTELADGLLIHIISHKLDQTTQEKWEESLPTDKLPKWTDMATFLEKRCRMLENVDSAVSKNPSQQVSKHSSKPQSRSILIASSPQTHSSCPLCNAKDHFLSKCSKFLSLSPQLRHKEAKRMHLCLNCLRKGHVLQQCRSGHCKHCPYNAPSVSLAQAVVVPQPTSSSALISTSSDSPPEALKSKPAEYVLLPTAIIYAKSRSGTFLPCRALLDSASQLNFITARLAKQLQLKTHRSRISISGIGESSLSLDQSVDIAAESHDKTYTTSFSAVIARTITDYQPHFNLNIDEWNIPKNIKLADPLFNESQRIDLLLGAGLFFDLICVGQIRIADNLPSLQKTRLGWILSGGCSNRSGRHSSLAALRMLPENLPAEEPLDDIVKRFWEIDSCCGSMPAISDEDALCEQLFVEGHTRLDSGQYSVALCGDICKMYRCVRVTHPDEYLQCILWRDNPQEKIRIYKLDTITYGTKPAAFLAIRAMHQLACDEEEDFQLAAKIVCRDFYVDDLISGGDSAAEASQIRRQVKDMLRKGGFPIRKWCSNDAEALIGESESEREKLMKFHDGSDIAKALGLAWDTSSDDLLFNFANIMLNARGTKRSILSAIAKFYDPLGLIAPIITKMKIFLQALWKENLDWDESLPQSLHSSWIELTSQISFVCSLKFPRYVMLPAAKWEIHSFCDASMVAYGSCIYIRSETHGLVSTRLLCSKSRVAPLKTLTIPKLELSAALLLSELIVSIAKSVQFECTYHCWSDSTVALAWIREAPSNFNAFVSNRVSQIQERTKGMIWHHVPTQLNPADILSRGCTPLELLNNHLWAEGPEFLRLTSAQWPQAISYPVDLPERRHKALISSAQTDLSTRCKFQNSFGKLQRVFAYIDRFLGICNKELARRKGPLTIEDIKRGAQLLIKSIHLVHFAEDCRALRAGKQLSTKSEIRSLQPILDPAGLLRVGGRLQNSDLDYEAKHPLLLPRRHPVTLRSGEHLPL